MAAESFKSLEQMKLIFKIIYVTVAVAFAVSCSKEPDLNGIDSTKVNISVPALLNELVSEEGETKSDVALVIRLTWSEGDVVYAYDNKRKLGELTVTPTSDKRGAMLTGAIDAPSSGVSKITFVYCNAINNAPELKGGGILDFDFSIQDKSTIPFVAYGVLDYNNQSNIKNQQVSFHFATSFMRVTVTGLDISKQVDNASISGINTVCELSLKADASPVISGKKVGTITKSGSKNFTKADERAIFNVGIVKDENTGRFISVAQGETQYKSYFTASKLKENTSYVSAFALYKELRGVLAGHEFVVIAGKKWATMNVGATEVVGPNSYGDYYVPGTVDTAYKSIDRETGKFVFKDSNPYGDRFGGYWKADKGFSEANMPFVVRQYDTSFYSKYDKSVDNRKQLDPEDDAAHVLWGGDWRTPTASEFEDLITATYWAWDEYDKGFYVYEPVSDQDAGKIDFVKVNSALYNRSNALLFFPSAGYGYGTSLNYSQVNRAFYLTSTVDIYDRFMAMMVDGYNSETNPWSCYGNQYCGYPVRPISDFENSVPVEKGMEVGDYIQDYGGGVVFKCDNDGGFYLVSLKEASNKPWEESKNWCKTYGDGEWYMPNIEELSLLQQQLSKVNYTLRIYGKAQIRIDNICYWSSTENGNCAWRMQMSTGKRLGEGTDEHKTSTKNLVRAIRYVPGTE